MAYRLIWSPTARFDLREIAEYISEDDPFAAHKFFRHLIQTVERLQVFPESGRVVPEFANPSAGLGPTPPRQMRPFHTPLPAAANSQSMPGASLPRPA